MMCYVYLRNSGIRNISFKLIENNDTNLFFRKKYPFFLLISLFGSLFCIFYSVVVLKKLFRGFSVFYNMAYSHLFICVGKKKNVFLYVFKLREFLPFKLLIKNNG